MDDLVIARVVHVVAVLMWIGGVAFVTTVAMPAIRQKYDAQARLSAFHALESGFSWQAKIWVLLAGASGFWMTWRADLWGRFTDMQYWWMWAMLLIWAIFSLMLFVLEPLFLHKRMVASPYPGRDFRRMEIIHRVLLAGSVVATVGAVGGVHGLW
jgi:uncharacterized membrane protein